MGLYVPPNMRQFALLASCKLSIALGEIITCMHALLRYVHVKIILMKKTSLQVVMLKSNLMPQE